MRLGSLIEAASATVPERISGSAKVALAEHRIRSADSASSRPPPQQMPFTAAITGLFRLGSSCKPPKPPTPQSPSTASPSAAAFRSQPGQKNFSPAARRIQTRKESSSRKSRNTSPITRLVFRLIALALGASSVTSRIAPSRRVLIGPSVRISILSLSDKSIDRDSPLGPHEDRVDFDFFKAAVGQHQIAQLHSNRRHRRHVGLGPPAIPVQQRPKPQAAHRIQNCCGGRRQDQGDGIGQNLGRNTAHANRQADAVDRIASIAPADASKDLPSASVSIWLSRGAIAAAGRQPSCAGAVCAALIAANAVSSPISVTTP